MLFEISNWLVALALIVLVAHISARLWTTMTHRRLWLIWICCWILLLFTYLLKAAQVSIGPSPFHIEWGLGRRWGDVSHWFTVLLLFLAWLPSLAAYLTRLSFSPRMRFPILAATIFGQLIYLLLVRAGDDGQTIFYPSGWLTPVKWIQVVEGAINLFLIGAAQIYIVVLILTLIRAAQMLTMQLEKAVVVFGAYLTALLTVAFFVLFRMPFELAPAIEALVGPDMPGLGQELKGPKPFLVVYQCIGLLLVPFLLAMIVSALHTRGDESPNTEPTESV